MASSDQSAGRITRLVNGMKNTAADILQLHDEPVFRCPVEGCDHTANYGRGIWNHQYKDHHSEVMADGE